MNHYSSKLGFCAVAAFGLTMFVACGDSNTTEVTESTGLDVVAKGGVLPECGNENAGDMLYVTDSAAVYYCADGKWATLNGKDGVAGEKGEKGEVGAEGKATNGTSCTAEKTEDGIAVSCDGKLVGTLENGKNAYELSGSELTLEKWLESLKGNTGESCTAKESKDEQGKVIGYDLTCGTTEIGTVYNGSDGKSGIGCKIEDKGNGAVDVTCGKNGTPVTLYKAMCGSESYDPKVSGCCDQTVYSLESNVCDSRDNQLYKTVEICDKDNANCQTWMAQNLNYDYNVKTAKSWCGGGVSGTTNEGDCSVYGRLYLWSAAMDSAAVFSDDGKDCGYYENEKDNKCEASGKTVRGACPSGWHLPTDAEWNTLISNAGGADIAGQKLKANSTLWTTKDGVTNDDSFGFAVLPAGGRNFNGTFMNRNDDAYFWSSTENYDVATVWFFEYCWGDAIRDDIRDDEGYKKNLGLSVRCLKGNPSASN